MTEERPILFSAPMVRAILDGHKTQTRRIVKSPWKNRPIVYLPDADPMLKEWFADSANPADPHCWGIEHVVDLDPMLLDEMDCPYGKPGDGLWVRETFAHGRIDKLPHPIKYRADHPEADTVPDQYGRAWTPSIHMPRWASRIDLLITAVRVERLQDISEADAKAEGMTFPDGMAYGNNPQDAFRGLWSKINGPESWDANPWVWAITFKRLNP